MVSVELRAGPTAEDSGPTGDRGGSLEGEMGNGLERKNSASERECECECENERERESTKVRTPTNSRQLHQPTATRMSRV